MEDIWNQRYAQEEYVYGVNPNEFYKEELSKLQPGKILFPAEGEGRNAVYAAIKGWDVVAFDSSEEAKKKAEKLAEKNNVRLNYQTASIEEFEYDENSFDAIVLIYVHTMNREQNHQKLLRMLKPGGVIILEGFSKEQLMNNSGGPRNSEMLFSEEELTRDFNDLKEKQITKTETELNEGQLHKGKASVIRLLGIK
ncbi:MAG: class I SAM-dependent methyltransferase [Paludibacter sp.]|nr:class I SAM-dependent methyltransferase [Paludibacter sp.]